MVEKSFERHENIEIEYEETFVNNFVEGADMILQENDEYDETVFNTVICDIDGATVVSEKVKFGDIGIKNSLVQYPLLCYLVSPNIKEETKRAFEELSNDFEGRMVIATNRDRRVRFPWSSNKVLNEADRLAQSEGRYIPIYERMQKQVPFLAKERAQQLVQYLGRDLVESDNYEKKEQIVLNSIEDKSIFVPNRGAFLKYIAVMLRKEFGMKVRIKNYVIR